MQLMRSFPTIPFQVTVQDTPNMIDQGKVVSGLIPVPLYSVLAVYFYAALGATDAGSSSAWPSRVKVDQLLCAVARPWLQLLLRKFWS